MAFRIMLFVLLFNISAEILDLALAPYYPDGAPTGYDYDPNKDTMDEFTKELVDLIVEKAMAFLIKDYQTRQTSLHLFKNFVSEFLEKEKQLIRIRLKRVHQQWKRVDQDERRDYLNETEETCKIKHDNGSISISKFVLAI